MLVYWEPPANSWAGPFVIVARDNTVVSLAVDGDLKQFSVGKVKRYQVAPAATATPNG